jgi:hypothetical protein
VSDPRAEKTALVAGAVGMGACVIGALVSGPDAFFQAYLVGVIFWIEIAFGCLGIQMIHALTGGGWGMLARRPLYAGSSTMPFCALAFLPLLAGLPRLYPWARPEVVAADKLIQHKAAYLNGPFFAARAVLYFAVWSTLALVLFQRAKRRDGKPSTGRSMRMIAGPGILASGLTMTFAAIDWLMSLDPHWFSTMFGLLVIVGSLLGALCFSILVVTSETSEEDISKDRLHDLGKLLLVFVMLWAYLSFSQYLIIYAGNMAEDVPFFVHRSHGGWQHLALGLIVLHFAVPFVVLLTRRTKRSPKALRAVAVGILGMRLIELFWFAAPNFRGHHIKVTFLDVAAPVGIGGFWLFWFSRRLRALDAGTGTGSPSSESPPSELTRRAS